MAPGIKSSEVLSSILSNLTVARHHLLCDMVLSSGLRACTHMSIINKYIVKKLYLVYILLKGCKIKLKDKETLILTLRFSQWNAYYVLTDFSQGSLARKYSKVLALKLLISYFTYIYHISSQYHYQ